MSNPSFTDRLLVLFGAPNSTNDDLLIREYQRLLKSYSDDIINAAIDRLARTHKYAGWPKIADCVAAAEDAIEARNWKERADNSGEPTKNDQFAGAALMSRRFVNGVGGNGSQWSSAFQDHPWVVLAENEGWGRDLRSACLRQAHLRYLGGVVKDSPTVENVMPDAETVAHWRKESQRAREAAQWRKENPEHRSIKGHAKIDVAALLKRNRDAYEAENNEVSKRIVGERVE